MPRRKEEMELLGFLPPRPGEDPRFGDNPIDIVDNGAFRDIENLEDDFRTGLDVEADPFLPQVTDDDGVPGYRPYVDASNTFEQQEGLPSSVSEEEEEIQNVRTPGEADEELLGDELAEKIRTRGALAVGEDGRPVSDLVLLGRVAHAEQQAQAQVAPYRQINPPSAATALLGGNADAQAQAGPKMVVYWVGEDTESRAVTITWSSLGLVYQNPLAVLPGPRQYVRIRWGTRSSSHEVTCDVGFGNQITIAASSVYVELINDDPLGSDTVYRLQASIGFFTAVRQTPLILTSEVNVAGAATAYVQRPNFATTIFDFQRDNVTDPYTIGFQSSRLNSSGTGSTTNPRYQRILAANTYFSYPIGVSNDIQYIFVTNGGAAPGASPSRVMWGLSL